ncbi:OmpH family outer membrane protein [Geomonas sp. RF6]|uniref:OmpH family outer membrane protein n=1 Tax=Geomonas sp. RF6 TaxID=2897342 RepID=UPI001E562B19|nr:OmpH family outer membrane protein [Geomonas sp. RF6]UFS69944.1 OmpH family outer membrane protein [Geomonas sp. RF6]
MNKRVALLLNLAIAALLAGSAYGAESTAPAASQKAPATSAPVFASLSSAKTATPAPSSSVKVGYVDLTRVATESETGKAAKAELIAKSDKARAKLQAKQSQLEKQKKAIEAKLPTMTPQQREAKGKEFQKKVEEYQKVLRATEQEMMGAEDKVKGTVLKGIKAAATEYGRNNGFTVVVAKEEILFLSDSVTTEDITDKVAKLLDQKGTAK